MNTQAHTHIYMNIHHKWSFNLPLEGRIILQKAHNKPFSVVYMTDWSVKICVQNFTSTSMTTGHKTFQKSSSPLQIQQIVNVQIHIKIRLHIICSRSEYLELHLISQ